MTTGKLTVGTTIGVALAFAAPASAGFIDLSGGWRATWDDSLDGLVDIVDNGVTDGAQFIQKSAEFRQGSEGGIFPSIPIVFQQIREDASEWIVIDDEIIFNNTGEDWTGFQFDLVDDGNAVFDPVRTAASGGGGPIGFSIAPFTTAEFSDDLQRLDIGGGTLSDGDFWFPGDGGDDGQLWIDVVVGAMGEFTVFTLKETPVPGPAALALLALGGVATRRRRG
jgi:MYXO-CTERM domain-containing protein